MKLILLSLITILLSLSAARGQSKIKSKWNGETYYTQLPDGYQVSEIKWNPSEAEIPISAKQAHEIAQSWMKQNFPESPFFIYAFKLYNFTPKQENGTWMWAATIKNGTLHVKEEREDGSTLYEGESFDLFIRMDRETFGPSKLSE